MYWALVSLGYTMKSAGSGGSYGYGKAGLITGSRIRTICAYTCFREQEEEPGITRRLLGMTYWGQHDLRGFNFTGFARFGNCLEGDGHTAQPFENAEADSVAASLGIKCRDPEEIENLGTTFLVVDPTVDPADLVRAIERNWWPALVESDFAISVFDYDGTEIAPRPKRDPVLKTFIDAWEIANERSNPAREREIFEQLILSRSLAQDGLSKGRVLGRLALASNLEDWSYADQRGTEDGAMINHRSLVALVRGPRMVVEYSEAGQAPPYVRGVFAANSDEVGERRSIDDYLRQTEPKAHDSWRSSDADGDLDPEAAAVAGEITRLIRRRVDAFRKTLKPVLPKAEDVTLPVFNDLMRKVLKGDSKGVPLPSSEVRQLSIVPVTDLEVSDQGLIRVRGHVAFTLTEHAGLPEATVDLFIAYRFMEDDRIGDPASVEYDLSRAEGFRQVSAGTFRGRMMLQVPVRIDFVTEFYVPDWTGRLVIDGEIKEPDVEGTGS